MKDDLIKFRRIVTSLLAENKLTKQEIQKILEVSEPTYYKLLNEDINTISIRASMLAKVQLFNKTYIQYATIESTPVKKKGRPAKEKPEKKEKKKAWEEKVCSEEIDNKINEAKKLLKGYDPADRKPPITNDIKFWNIIRTIHECMPENITITISIKSK